MNSDQQAAAEVAEALNEKPSDGSEVKCYQALAEVAQEDPVYVFDDSDANGCNVTCTVLTGPFVGQTVTAMLACPVGPARLAPVVRGQRVLLSFLDGTLDSHIIVTHSVPGGTGASRMPSVVAGVPLDTSLAPSLADPKTDAPPTELIEHAKRAGSREYLRGGLKVFRLKGMQDDFFAGFVVSADDGTSLEVRWNSLKKGYQIEVKGAAGERLSVGGGFASLFSADGKASVQVSNGQVLINADKVIVNGNIATQIDGGAVCIGMNGAPPVPGVNSCAVGPGTPLNLFSAHVFIGIP